MRAGRRIHKLHFHIGQLLVQALDGDTGDVDVHSAKNNRISVEQQVCMTLTQDALQDRSKSLFDFLAGLKNTPLDLRLPRLHFLLERLLLRFEGLDLLCLHIGRENSDLLLKLLLLRTQ